MKTKYVTVKLPEGLIIIIDNLKIERAYTSRTDVIKDSVRLLKREKN